MSEMIRIWRSPKSAMGHLLRMPDAWQEETVLALDAYTDGELSKIATSGFNAIWIHGNLSHVARSSVFPELGKDAGLHQERLRLLVERAGRHGLKLFMYCQPPRAISSEDSFWTAHPDSAGQVEPFEAADGTPLRMVSLCTSTEKVRRHLFESAAKLARKIPGLGGLIIITASEYPAHCWSRRGRVIQGDGSVAQVDIECPRCAIRKPEEVVAEVVHLIRDGVRSVTADWEVIAWNWSWTFYNPAPCAEIISQLPKDVILLVDFERGGRKVIAGRERVVDEYSLSYAGPSEQFAASLEAARRHGLRVMAKLQFGTTHELATVPNLPVLGNVFAKADSARRMGLAGFMGCWCFGNMTSANTAAFNAFLSGRLPTEKVEALKAFAGEYFPGCDADAAAKAWLKFGEAMDHYPFSIPYLYMGPTNFAFVLPMSPAPLTGKPVGRSWMSDERGDDMAAALGEYGVEEVVDCLERLAEIWGEGLRLLQGALSGIPEGKAELDTAEVCWRSFRSAGNFAKVYRLRRQWSDRLLPEYRSIIRDELENLGGVLPILRRDARFGYHIEAHAYQYTPDAVEARISALQAQLESTSKDVSSTK